MKLVVMIPAYNEEKTIGQVIRDVPRKIEGINEVSVLVINDGSNDKTKEVSVKAGADEIITHIKRRGLARAFKSGLMAALKMNADIIVNLDADYQYDPKQIPELIKPILKGQADVVLGSRFKGYIEYMPIQKKIGNKIATYVVKKLTGLNISDAQSGFRAFSRKAAMKLNVLSKYTYTQETLIMAAYKGLKVMEIPVLCRKRKGKSRLISNIFSYAKNAGLTIFLTYLSYKPMKVFLSIGLLIMLLVSLIGIRLFFLLSSQITVPYIILSILAIILLTIGFQAITISFIAEMVKSNRELIEDLLYQIRDPNLQKKTV